MSVLIDVSARLVPVALLLQLFPILGKLSHSALIQRMPLFVLGKFTFFQDATVDEFIIFKLVGSDNDLLLVLAMRVEIDRRMIGWVCTVRLHIKFAPLELVLLLS